MQQAEERKMQPMDESVQTLVNLGLTLLQAKVYLALAKSGTLSGRAVAKAAKVASQDVYRILNELQEIGLVEKIISRPNKYKPIPLKNSLSMLLQRRNTQTTQLKKSIIKMFRGFQDSESPADKKETGDFILIPGKEPTENRIKMLLGTAQTSIDLMNEYQEGITGHEINFDLEIKALNNGVKIRDILYRTKKRYQPPKKFSVLLERKPEFQVKYHQSAPPVILCIKDNKEVLISTTKNANSLAQPYLWTNNPNLVHVIQQWYDTIWEKCGQT
jgi:sugar-specific transcriptional regulator TrmB